MPSAPLPLVDPDLLQELFDRLPDVVFFIKDRQGRYTHANQTLVQRLGLGGREAVIGRSANELFPPRLGDGYAAQDRRVLAGGRIEDQLEMHMFQNRAAGW